MDRFPVLTVSPQSLAEILSEHPSLSIVPDKHAPGDYCVTLDSGTVIARGIVKDNVAEYDAHLKESYKGLCSLAQDILDPLHKLARFGDKRFESVAAMFVGDMKRSFKIVGMPVVEAEEFIPGEKVQDARTGEPLTVVKMLEHGGVLIEYPSGVRQQYYPEDLKKVSVQKLGTADKPATVGDLDRARRQAQTELMENDQVVIQTDDGALDGKTGVIRFVSQSPEGTKYTVALDEMVEFAGQMVPQVELPASQVRKAMKRQAKKCSKHPDVVAVGSWIRDLPDEEVVKKRAVREDIFVCADCKVEAEKQGITLIGNFKRQASVELKSGDRVKFAYGPEQKIYTGVIHEVGVPYRGVGRAASVIWDRNPDGSVGKEPFSVSMNGMTKIEAQKKVAFDPQYRPDEQMEVDVAGGKWWAGWTKTAVTFRDNKNNSYVIKLQDDGTLDPTDPSYSKLPMGLAETINEKFGKDMPS